MTDLIPHIQKHFADCADRYSTFSRMGIQLEGWVKGELLFLFDSLMQEGKVDRIYREVSFENSSRRKVDLVVRTRDDEHWVELKYWLVGEQKNTRYRPSFYFKDASHVGIIGDVRKLLEVQSSGKLFLHRDESW